MRPEDRIRLRHLTEAASKAIAYPPAGSGQISTMTNCFGWLRSSGLATTESRVVRLTIGIGVNLAEFCVFASID